MRCGLTTPPFMQVLPIKRRSSCDIRGALLRGIVCSQDDAVLVHPELLVPVWCSGNCGKLCTRKLHKLVRRYARVVRTVVVRLSDECVRLSFERRRTVLCVHLPASVCTAAANCCHLGAGCSQTVRMC